MLNSQPYISLLKCFAMSHTHIIWLGLYLDVPFKLDLLIGILFDAQPYEFCKCMLCFIFYALLHMFGFQMILSE